MSSTGLLALLENDAEFDRFLRDDEFATAKLNELRGAPRSDFWRYDLQNMGAIYTGITPGTGS